MVESNADKRGCFLLVLEFRNLFKLVAGNAPVSFVLKGLRIRGSRGPGSARKFERGFSVVQPT